MILKQGAENFSEDFEELKKEIKILEKHHRPQLTEVDKTASIASKKHMLLHCAILFKSCQGSHCLGIFSPPESRLNFLKLKKNI